MEISVPSRTSGTLRYILLSLAILFVVAYLLVAVLRISYPFELEWMEGASVDHVARILSGQKLYVPPSLEFVPFLYTPLYFYASAAVSKVVGSGFFPLRLLSFLSSLGCFFVIFLWVKRETGSHIYGILSLSLFAATFRASGFWFDVGRADSLFLLLLLVGLYLIRFKNSARWYVLSGLFISLAFLTKQMALVVFLAVAIYCVWANRRLAFYLIGTVFVTVTLSTLILDWMHEGWYTFYVFDLPRQHSLLSYMWIDFWTFDIMSPLSITFLVSIFYLTSRFLIPYHKKYNFYVFMLGGMLLGSWFSRLHPGGYLNVLFPAYAGLAILFGLAIHRIFEFIATLATGNRKTLLNYVYAVCIIQFCLLIYNPFSQIPGKRDLKAGRAFVEVIRDLPGKVLMPYHGYLPSLAGKRCCAHEAAIHDVLTADDCPAKTLLMDEINQALREKRFDWVVINAPWFVELVEENYVRWSPVFDRPDVFWPPVGYQTRPELIFISRTEYTDSEGE